MDMVDLRAIEELTTSAALAVNRMEEQLIGRDGHPFVSDSWTPGSLVVALGVQRLKDAVEALTRDLTVQIDHYPVPNANPEGPGLHYVDGRIYSGDDGHTYWLDNGSWVGAGTMVDGTVDDQEGTYIGDFDLSNKQTEALDKRLTNFWGMYGPKEGDGSPLGWAVECTNCGNSIPTSELSNVSGSPGAKSCPICGFIIKGEEAAS